MSKALTAALKAIQHRTDLQNTITDTNTSIGHIRTNLQSTLSKRITASHAVDSYSSSVKRDKNKDAPRDKQRLNAAELTFDSLSLEHKNLSHELEQLSEAKSRIIEELATLSNPVAKTVLDENTTITSKLNAQKAKFDTLISIQQEIITKYENVSGSALTDLEADYQSLLAQRAQGEDVTSRLLKAEKQIAAFKLDKTVPMAKATIAGLTKKLGALIHEISTQNTITKHLTGDYLQTLADISIKDYQLASVKAHTSLVRLKELDTLSQQFSGTLTNAFEAGKGWRMKLPAIAGMDVIPELSNGHVLDVNQLQKFKETIGL